MPLAAYAARKTNGALTLLVINKDATTNFNAQLVPTNFVPWPGASIRSYGTPQDEAVRTNGPVSSQDIQLTNHSSASTRFGYAFPPYSLTLFTFAPTAPQLLVRLLLNGGGQANTLCVFQLQGQQNVRYVIQSSTNLQSWVSLSTNTLTGSTLNLTDTVLSSVPVKFWRAARLP